MSIFFLIFISFAASWLTFFSGFGLGTILTPVFFLFFNDLQLAVTATAIVHFLNNVFKFLLMRRKIDWTIVLPFGMAAIPAAFLGAFLLTSYEDFILFTYSFDSKLYHVYMMNFIFGIILVGFSLIELIPVWSLAFSKRSLVLGGVISGFFGGISGHQGALRTAFLIRYNLEKQVFIATGIVIAVIIDIVRTTVYFAAYDFSSIAVNWILILCSLSAALAGAVSGKLLLNKMNMKTLTVLISIAMLVFGLTLSTGLLNK